MGSSEVTDDADGCCSTEVADAGTSFDVSSIGLLVTTLLISGTKVCVIGETAIDVRASIADVKTTLWVAELKTEIDDV